jgi:hypothetical protein
MYVFSASVVEKHKGRSTHLHLRFDANNTTSSRKETDQQHSTNLNNG